MFACLLVFSSPGLVESLEGLGGAYLLLSKVDDWQFCNKIRTPFPDQIQFSDWDLSIKIRIIFKIWVFFSSILFNISGTHFSTFPGKMPPGKIEKCHGCNHIFSYIGWFNERAKRNVECFCMEQHMHLYLSCTEYLWKLHYKELFTKLNWSTGIRHAYYDHHERNLVEQNVQIS